MVSATYWMVLDFEVFWRVERGKGLEGGEMVVWYWGLCLEGERGGGGGRLGGRGSWSVVEEGIGCLMGFWGWGVDV